MMLDPFMAQLGLGRIEQELPEDTISALCDTIETFLRGGGAYTPQEWISWGPLTRAAFVRANELIWRERCAMIGRATQSELHAAFTESEEAGQDALASLAVDRMVRNTISKAQKAS